MNNELGHTFRDQESIKRNKEDLEMEQIKLLEMKKITKHKNDMKS